MCVIVTITGMNGVGKSLLMQNLAALTAMNGFITGCMTTDMTYPELQYKFMGTIIDPECNLLKQFWEKEPTKYFTPIRPTKVLSNLYITGVPTNTQCHNYNPPESGMLQEKYFDNLKDSDFDVIFVEAGNPLMNSISATAIEKSDLAIILTEISNKGQAWFDAYYRMLLGFCDNRGALIVTTETWHHFSKKEAANTYKVAGFNIPFSALAGVGGEDGVPLVCAARMGALLEKEDNAFIAAIGSLQSYIAHGAWSRRCEQNRNVILADEDTLVNIGKYRGPQRVQQPNPAAQQPRPIVQQQRPPYQAPQQQQSQRGTAPGRQPMQR